MLRVVLPALFVALLAGAAAAAPRPARPAPPKRPPEPRTPKPMPLEPGPWSIAILAAARADLGKGEHPAGTNRGPYPDALLAAVGQAPGQNYCAAAVAKWIRDAAAELGRSAPIAGSAGAKATMAQLQAAGCWAPIATVRAGYRPPPGSIGVSDRSDPKRPETAWWGHIFVLNAWEAAGRFSSIEANRTDRVALFDDRKLDDQRLLGFGNLDASWGLLEMPS